MWFNLQEEMGALKQECFSARYNQIRESAKANSSEPDRWKQIQEIENAYLYLVSYVATHQDDEGWWGDQHKLLMTAHVVRLFSKMGISLKDRWFVSRNRGAEGNLFLATRNLASRFDKSTDGTVANWGDDLWDECHVLAALLAVEPQLHDPEVKAWEPTLALDVDDYINQSQAWLMRQVGNGFDQLKQKDWYGPGFFAAAIDIFDQPGMHSRTTKYEQLIAALVEQVVPLIQESLTPGSIPHWHDRYPWHVGQLILKCKEKCDRYPAIKSLEPNINDLYRQLLSKQTVQGTWEGEATVSNEEYRIYYTIRGLAACYVMEADPATSPAVAIAHTYLLRKLAEPQPLVNIKGCINTMDAFDKLFGLRIPTMHLSLLVSLTSRLDRLGLLGTFLNPLQNEVGILRTIRAIAKEKLEDKGESALEPLGVNHHLFEALKTNQHFLDEFTREKAGAYSEHARIREELQHFLSSTMTETRSNSSRRLIRRLWENHGFLNFIPLIEHLSDLESNRAFFKFYRDHLNHEVLLFLLGTYLYFNSAPLRERLDKDIAKTYEGFPIRFKDRHVREFLFRWKMVSTFHDIGYLFEVAPDPNDGLDQADLLEQSFGVIDTVRREFLVDYLAQYIKPDRDSKGTEVVSAKEKAAVLVTKIRNIKEYQPSIPKIERPEDLFELETAGDSRDAFAMINNHLTTRHNIPPSLIRNYFELCRSTSSEGDLKRQSFLDHGIMSALLLLKTADMQRYYLQQLVDNAFRKQLASVPDLPEILGDYRTHEQLEEEQFYIRFSHVAGAIALHNIYPHLYTKEQCLEFDAHHPGSSLTDSFRGHGPGERGTYGINVDDNALAYLTALADVLQDWDRHSFARPTFADSPNEPIASAEVALHCKDNIIHVTPLTKAAKAKYAAMAGSKGLSQYLIDWEQFLKIHL